MARVHILSMADELYQSEINDALLLQADDGITYSPGFADHPPLNHPSSRPRHCSCLHNPTPPQVGLATANDGAQGKANGAKASGLARAMCCLPPNNYRNI